MTEKRPAQGQAVPIDDGVWEELLELTAEYSQQGAMAACYQCGVCTATCPWGQVRQQTFSVRNMMRRAQVGMLDGDEGLWLCTTCRQCEAYCPRGVPISDVFRSLRYIAWERRQTPAGLPGLLWSTYWNNNPWSQPPSHRSHWAKDLDVPAFDSTQHELLYYVGCTSAYDRRAQKVARALVCLLEAAGVRYGTLGDQEPCCGEAVLNVGHIAYFQEIAQQNAQLFAGKGVRQLMAISPHCYDVFRNHYPMVQPDFQPYHYTQYLAHLLDAGRLHLDREIKLKVAFHDPCYLGRHNQEFQCPRRVLDAIPGIERVEMPHFGADALCCGGGGGHMWLETKAGERFADMRVQEARDTGAQVLVTACPACIACLEDSIKALGLPDLKVMDVAEIAAMALTTLSTLSI